MWIGAVELELLLGDVRSLKQKRSVVKPILAEMQRHFAVSVAEVDHLDKHRRASLGAAVVAADRAHVVAVLEAVEELVARHPEIAVLSAHHCVRRSDD